MNYDAPRQRQSDGKWHYTRSNKRTGVYPIGNCAEDCPGHDTAEEACEHQKEYLLDRVQFTEDSADAGTLHRCEARGCETMTSGSAAIGGSRHWHLCAAHRNREIVSGLLSVWESWGS